MNAFISDAKKVILSRWAPEGREIRSQIFVKELAHRTDRVELTVRIDTGYDEGELVSSRALSETVLILERAELLRFVNELQVFLGVVVP